MEAVGLTECCYIYFAHQSDFQLYCTFLKLVAHEINSFQYFSISHGSLIFMTHHCIQENATSSFFFLFWPVFWKLWVFSSLEPVWNCFLSPEIHTVLLMVHCICSSQMPVFPLFPYFRGHSWFLHTFHIDSLEKSILVGNPPWHTGGVLVYHMQKSNWCLAGMVTSMYCVYEYKLFWS